MKGRLFLFYANGRGEVFKEEALRVGPARVEFRGGGWNETEECFLTEAQCRRFKRLPPVPQPKMRAAVLAVLSLLEAAAAKLRGALE